jgi:hypothetical protein
MLRMVAADGIVGSVADAAVRARRCPPAVLTLLARRAPPLPDAGSLNLAPIGATSIDDGRRCDWLWRLLHRAPVAATSGSGGCYKWVATAATSGSGGCYIGLRRLLQTGFSDCYIGLRWLLHRAPAAAKNGLWRLLHQAPAAATSAGIGPMPPSLLHRWAEAQVVLQ